MSKEIQKPLTDVSIGKIDRAIADVRSGFQEIAHGTPQAEALIDKAMLLKSCADNIDDEKIELVKNKIFRREEESGEYAYTSHKLAILIQETCFYVDNKKAAVKDFSDKLGSLLAEFYAEDYEEASNKLLNLHRDSVQV